MIVASGVLFLVTAVLLVQAQADQQETLALPYAALATSLLALLVLALAVRSRRRSAARRSVASGEPALAALSQPPRAQVEMPIEAPVEVPPGADPVPATRSAAPTAVAAEGHSRPEVDPVEEDDYGDVLVVSGRPRYHVEGCRYLTGEQAEPLGVVEAREEGFSPCGICHPDVALAVEFEEDEDEDGESGALPVAELAEDAHVGRKGPSGSAPLVAPVDAPQPSEPRTAEPETDVPETDVPETDVPEVREPEVHAPEVSLRTAEAPVQAHEVPSSDEPLTEDAFEQEIGEPAAWFAEPILAQPRADGVPAPVTETDMPATTEEPHTAYPAAVVPVAEPVPGICAPRRILVCFDVGPPVVPASLRRVPTPAPARTGRPQTLAPSTGSPRLTTPPLPQRGGVVIIAHRVRYHRPECRYVRDVADAQSLTKAQATGQGHRPCGVCKP